MNLKSEKFKEFAERRVNKALYAINNIGKLSNKSAYEWNDSQIKQIVTSLKAEIRAIESKFENSRSQNTNLFKFDS